MSDRMLATPLDGLLLQAEPDDEKYLIWSYEHDMWWMPDRCGYTRDRTKAGRYSKAEAVDICENANHHVRPGEPFEEIAVAESELAIFYHDKAPRASDPVLDGEIIFDRAALDAALRLLQQKDEELAAHDDLHRQAAHRIEQLVRDLAIQREATEGAREIIRLALTKMREPLTHTDARRAREILQKYHHECAVAAVRARREAAPFPTAPGASL